MKRHVSVTIGPKPWTTIEMRGGRPGHRWCRIAHISDTLMTGPGGVFDRFAKTRSAEEFDAAVAAVDVAS